MKTKELERPLKEAVNAVLPALLKGELRAGDGISKEDFEQIFYRLLVSTNIDDANRLIKQFNEYLVSVGAVHRDENPGVSISRLKRPRARITTDVAADLKKLLLLEQAFLESLETIPIDLEAFVGQILFSALRHGALLRTDLLKGLITALDEPPHMLEGHLWFELPLHEGDPGQIWKPDAMTMLLLCQWYSKDCHLHWKSRTKSVGGDWMRLIKRFFFHQGRKWKRHGLSRLRLLAAINARLSLEMPAVLVDCAQGAHDSRTLHPTTFLRLISGKAPPFTPKKDAGSNAVKPPATNVIPIKTGDCSSNHDHRLLLAVGKLLRSNKTPGAISKAIRERIEDERRHCTPISVYLCEWVAKRLTSPNRWGNRFSPKSAYTRLRSITRRLQGWLGSENPNHVGIGKLTEIYEEIIDSVDSQNLRSSIAKNLRDFQECLEDERGAAPLDSDAPWIGVGTQKGMVDAKIILPKEYTAASSHYLVQSERENNSTEKALYQARYLVMALGYKAGLRRKEAIGLRIKDITTEGSMEALVRPHDERKLKSLAGNRRLPLHVLFDSQELEQLRVWVALRKSHGAAPDNYLFSLPSLGTPFIEESQIFDHIQWLLQTLTGDPATRFHHLRHSFGTWRFLGWMYPRYKDLLMHYDGMKPMEEERIMDERRVVLGLARGDEPSQKVMYGLSMAIGHSGPSMTLSHYIHSVPWMLEQELGRLTPEIDPKVAANYAGVTVRQIQKLTKQKRCAADILIPRLLRKIKKIAKKPDLGQWQDPSSKNIGEYKREAARERCLGMDIWEAIQRYSYQDSSLSELEERYCISRAELEAAISRATHISSMKYLGAGHQTYRHRLPEWQQLDEPPLIFSYPHQKRHLELVEHVLRRYEELPVSRRKLVQWGVKYFLNHGSARKSDIPFSKKEDLRRFLRILNVLKLYVTVPSDKSVKHPRYRLTLYSCFPKKSSERASQWRHWGRGIALHEYQRKDALKKSAQKKNGYVALHLLALSPASSPQRENPGTRQSDWGFRLSLYILATVFGREGGS